MNFLSEIGYPMTRLEKEGITSPVVSITCDYKHTTTYSDEIEIEVFVSGYTGVRLSLSYTMKDKANNVIVATATSVHCFICFAGNPISIRKCCPVLDSILKNMFEKGE